MKANLSSHLGLRLLAALTCLTWVAANSLAEPTLQQPASVVTAEQQTIPEFPAFAVSEDTQVAPAGCCDGGCSGGSCCNGGGCGNCCCEPVCCPKKVTEEVKKHCWKVSSEWVCIPGFHFHCNWRDSKCNNSGSCDTCCGGDSCGGGNSCCACPPKCGRVRCINVLEKHEYTCEECGYEWEVKCVRSSGSGGRGGCCSGGHGCGCCPSCGCAKVTSDSDDVQLTSATETEPTTQATTEVAEKPTLSKRLFGWMK